MKVKGEIALVTGAARRVGRMLALALGRMGVHVAVHYAHAHDAAQATVDELQHLGVRAMAFQADLTRPEAAPRLLDDVERHLGTPRILVNSAAVFEPGTVRETTLENWETHMALNLRAPFLLLQAFARKVGAGPGKVVNITDWRALYPGRRYLAYTVSKAGLVTLTQMAALELAPGIQVNALALGAVLPPPGKDAAYLDRLVQRTPGRRAIREDELASALRFLLENDAVTGEVLFLDAGAHLVHG